MPFWLTAALLADKKQFTKTYPIRLKQLGFCHLSKCEAVIILVFDYLVFSYIYNEWPSFCFLLFLMKGFRCSAKTEGDKLLSKWGFAGNFLRVIPLKLIVFE